MDNKFSVRVDHVTVRFNRSAQKVDSLKEYFVKAAKHELMFQEFFALQDVSLTVKPGESWGLIGRNGSGKSTLLKLICGIIAPYRGTVETRGSIAPMIELGAGFDGDLTARENVFLNGAILGHSQRKMEECFEEIVAFSEVGKFLDMPIKNYSSGMRARLGFAIATVVRPDILVVDEVLAVGDQAFQKKCEGKMRQLLSDGTTLLYVSHALGSVQKMCTHALWLDSGGEVMHGEAAPVCEAYAAKVG